MRPSFFLALLLLARTAGAADTRWGLRWRAPDECIGPAELASRVEQRLGRPVFGLNPDFRIDGFLEAQASEPKWKARVSVVSAAGDVLGSREVTGSGDCRSLDDRLAFVVSVSIDANVTEPKPEPKPEPAPPAPVAKPQPAPVAVKPGALWVELESDKPNTRLMRIASQGFGAVQNTSVYLTTYEKICVAPCEEFVASPSSDFFLTGDSMTSPPAFSLAQYRDGVRIKVKGGSLGARFAGVMLTSVGVASALVGGLFALIGGLTSPSLPGVQNPYGGTGSTFQTMGFGMLIGGAAAMGGGIPLIAFSGTKVEFFPTPAPNGLLAAPPNPNVTEL